MLLLATLFFAPSTQTSSKDDPRHAAREAGAAHARQQRGEGDLGQVGLAGGGKRACEACVCACVRERVRLVDLCGRGKATHRAKNAVDHESHAGVWQWRWRWL